jgi:hypothetical protein
MILVIETLSKTSKKLVGFEFDLVTNGNLSMQRTPVKQQDIKQARVVVVEGEEKMEER